MRCSSNPQTHCLEHYLESIPVSGGVVVVVDDAFYDQRMIRLKPALRKSYQSQLSDQGAPVLTQVLTSQPQLLAQLLAEPYFAAN